MRQVFHPRAFLTKKRNVRLGLIARTRIVQVLERQSEGTRGISNKSGLKYNVVIHHLRLLEVEKVIARRGDKRPFAWELTGAGQQRLTSIRER